MSVPEIDVAELAKRRAEGQPVVDVRQPDEYRAGHVPGAVLIPLDQLPDRLAELPDERPLLVVCRTGSRSKAAVDFLLSEGIDAVNVAGGTQAWIESGHAIATGDEAG